MARIFEVHLDRLGAVSAELEEVLRAERATNKEIRQTLLLVEEIVVKFSMLMPGVPVTATVARSFGKLTVKLSAEGTEHNPISETQDWAAGTENYYRTLILRAHKHLLGYHRVEGKNVVTIHVHAEEKKYVRFSLIALISGLVLGGLMRLAMPGSAVAWVETNVFSVIEQIFMNAMAIMVVPAVFCAVVDSITGLTSLSDTGRIGGRIMRLYSLTTVVAILVSFAISVPLFTHLVSATPELGQMAGGFAGKMSLRDFILSLVPENMITPIISGNMMQVLFVAVIMGVAMGIIGEKAEPLRRLIGAFNQLFQTIIALIAMVVPLLTFIATASLVARFGFGPLPIIGLLLFAELAGCAVMFGVYNIMLRIFGRVKAGPYARKTLRFFRKTNPRASSGEYLPKVVGLCTGQLGVSERVASFTAALGASVNMDGSAIHMVVCSVLMAQLFGVELSANTLLQIALMAFILSGGAAAVQNSGMLSVSSLAVLMGIPTTAITLLFGVDQILDLTRTASNAIGDVSVCVIIANRENELDLEAYAS